MIEKISEQRKAIEAKLHQKQIEVEQSRREVRTLEEVLQETKNQQKMLHEENRELIVQIRGKDGLILQAKKDGNAIEQQLQYLMLKIGNLRQEKFKLAKDIKKKNQKNV